MKIKSLAVFALLGVLLLLGAACGEGQGVEPTPTPTLTPTAAEATSTPTPTSTIDLAFCPPPAAGKANIAGVLVWNGESYYETFRTRGMMELYPHGSWIEIAGVKYDEGTIIARDSTDFDGYFCFRNLEPGEYEVQKECPAGTRELMNVFIGPILARADQTKWVEMDPYDICTK